MKTLLNATLVAVAVGVFSFGAAAADVKESAGEGDGSRSIVRKEKCYGIVRGGKNDCQTATNSCAGTAKASGMGDAWIYVPKGLCNRIVGSSTEPF